MKHNSRSKVELDDIVFKKFGRSKKPQWFRLQYWCATCVNNLKNFGEVTFGKKIYKDQWHLVTHGFCIECGKPLRGPERSPTCGGCTKMYNLVPGKTVEEKFSLLEQSKGESDENVAIAKKVFKTFEEKNNEFQVIYQCVHKQKKHKKYHPFYIDYNKPYIIMMMCLKCIDRLHARIRRGKQ